MLTKPIINKLKWTNIVVIIVSILILIVSIMISNIIVLFISVFILLVNVITLILVLSLTVFMRDKELELESLQSKGFIIVRCTECSKHNVLEDQYCIFCGEKLDENST